MKLYLIEFAVNNNYFTVNTLVKNISISKWTITYNNLLIYKR